MGESPQEKQVGAEGGCVPEDSLEQGSQQAKTRQAQARLVKLGH
jgi:hypothetical protein